MNKLAKIIITLLLLATYTFANWTGEVSEPELRTKIDGKIFYLISTPEELAWFAAQVNSGKTAINAKLSKDIVLWEDSLTSASDATSWTPIGDSLKKSFNGIFDGDNHKIRGVYLRKEAYRLDSICLGLFGCLGADGIVKNLDIENAYLTTSVKANYDLVYYNLCVGGVIGINDGRVENILFKGVLKTGGNVGGLVGKNNGHIENVSFDGSITGSGNVGGIVGFNTGTVKEAFSSGNIQSSGNIGGIVGYVENGLSIENCENKADIIAKKSYVGGIAGYVKTSTSILNSTNNGTLEGDSVAGIAGYASSTIIDNCKNEGTINAMASRGGGIITLGRSVIIRNCINNGSIGSPNGDGAGIATIIDSTSKIDNCINNGTVKADNAAGIVYSCGGKVINCVNNDTIIGISAAGIGNANVIDNCTNNGAVVSEGKSSCGEALSGGIAVYAYTIKNCTNNGSISASKIYHSYQDEYKCHIFAYAGGIAAQGYMNSYIGKSVNKGRVSAYAEFSHKPRDNYGSSNGSYRRGVYAGGITGLTRSKIADSYNLANVDARIQLNGSYLYDNGLWAGGIAGYGGSIQNVYSAADSVIGYISGGAKNFTYKGALFGQIGTGNAWNDYDFDNNTAYYEVNNAYYDLKIKNIRVPLADNHADTISVVGLSTTDMQKDQFAWILNTTAGTQENTSIWSRKDGYPIFANAENLPIYRVTFDDDGASNYYRYTYEYSNNKGVSSIPKNLDPAEEYRFVAWIDENGKVFDGKRIVSEDMIVSASYAPITAQIYTVTFEYPKGNEITVMLTNDDGSLDSLPHAPVVNENYIFKGWFDSSSSLVTKSTVFTANAIVTAVYETQLISSSSFVAESSSSFEESTSSSSATFSSSSEEIPTVIIASDSPTFNISVIERDVHIDGAKTGERFIVFDMQGRIMLTQVVNNEKISVSLPGAGSYIVRIGNHTQKISIK